MPAIHWFASLDSTNRFLLDAAAELPSGTLVVADEQTAGRGRQGRIWQSPPGVNLYASLLLKPPDLPASPPVLTQAASLAIYEEVRAAGVAGAWIKWPNDVLVEQRKLAGVLTECRLVGGQPAALVIGMGVNLNMATADLAAIGQPATSVAAETGHAVDRPAFCRLLHQRLLANLAELTRSGAVALHRRWGAASRLPGRRVLITQPTGALTGIVHELAPDGALVLRLADGNLHRCHAGEVSLRLANDAPSG